MNLGFGRSEGSDPPAWIDATEFAEVVYRTDDVLFVSVAADLAEDSLLANALMDVLATSERCDTAESAIVVLAAELHLDVRSGNGRGRGDRHLTIGRRAPAS